MHEFGLATSTVDMALRQLESAGGSRIERIRVKIGVIAGVDEEAFRFAFDTIKAGTEAADAILEIESVPAVAHCGSCDSEFEAEDDFIYACPHCGALSGDVRQGRELQLSRIVLSRS